MKFSICNRILFLKTCDLKNIKVELNVERNLDLFETEIPMLLQPFIENVFVHFLIPIQNHTNNFFKANPKLSFL
jgi:hypothetical protein